MLYFFRGWCNIWICCCCCWWVLQLIKMSSLFYLIDPFNKILTFGNIILIPIYHFKKPCYEPKPLKSNVWPFNLYCIIYLDWFAEWSGKWFIAIVRFYCLKIKKIKTWFLSIIIRIFNLCCYHLVLIISYSKVQSAISSATVKFFLHFFYNCSLFILWSA